MIFTMENFLKPFLKKDVAFLLENASLNIDGDLETNVIQFIKKIIFKHDVLVELKEVFNLVSSTEPFIVKNKTVKNIIKHLSILTQSNEDISQKIKIFRYIFQSFISSCAGNGNGPILQFFIVLSHILGMNAIPNASNSNETSYCNCLINEENFRNAFDVDISIPSQEFFSIFKELLLCLSKTNINLNVSEIQPYYKWLQQLIKSLANFQPFQNIFMEIFLISADIDLKLLEGNLEDIFCSILCQRLPDENFCEIYSTFLENSLTICAKFQRTIKFVSKFLSSIKVTSIYLDKEVILPSNVIIQFSKIVAVASNQLSLSLLDILVQNVNESFILISQNNAGSLLLFVASKLVISFLKEVKLYAPTIALTTLQAFINKLNIFKETLQKFGDFLFSNKSFILENEHIVKTFLELCFYCAEIQTLIDCYKDSILHPSNATESTTDFDWQCCLSSEQWKKLVNLVLKAKLETCALLCFQLVLQKLRISKIKKKDLVIENSTEKIIFCHLTSDLNKFNIFENLPPEDLRILIDTLTIKQFKSINKNIFQQILDNDNKEEWTTWLSNSANQENPVFIVSLFSEILKKTGSVLQDVISNKNYSKISWFLDEYFDNHNLIYNEIVEKLPEKINILLKSSKKIRKLSENLEKKELLIKIIEIFKLLPLPYMKNEFRRLGLSFAFGIGAILANDENAACLVFEVICSFLASDTDVSICCDVGLCIIWFSELSYESKIVNDIKLRVVECLIRNSPNTKFGLSQIGEMIDSIETFKHSNQLKMLETQVVLYNELGKCWQRAKKRKADNDLIGSYRIKIAKVISCEANKLQESNINPQNCKLLLKILAIELNKAIRMNEESEIANLMEKKFPSYFDFSVTSLKNDFDEASATFLTVVLQSVPQLRKFLPQDSFLKIWKALKTHEKVNWRLFCNHSDDEEFNEILNDLLKMSKKFLNSKLEKHSSNCFEIWISFFESGSGAKKNSCQLQLQDFFNYIHDCDLLLKDLPISKKIFLIQFLFFCVSTKEIILSSHMLDTIIFVMLESFDDSVSIEDFHSLFSIEAEVASAILMKQFAWSKSKIHLNFIIFKRMLEFLFTRCNAYQQINKDDIIKLSDCAFCLEKWVNLMVKKEKDFARISAYFIATLISSITSVTVLPAIKIHLTNCINHFLSITDSHTVAYLMRILKPGYQQVFNTLYDEFKKYHKYSGKI